MQVYSSQIIEYPIDVVYPLVRDNLKDLVPYLQNVKRIEVESRQDLGDGRVRLVNRWYAVGEIPKVVQSVIKPEMLTWLDTATWDDKEKTCRWDIETMFFKENVKCSGINYYKPEGDGKTRLEITGDLTIVLKGIPGVPKLLEKKIASQVEKFIVRLLTPNMSSLARGVSEHLSREA
jgi:hypothetical protein